jgi:hypothetical protein
MPRPTVFLFVWSSGSDDWTKKEVVPAIDIHFRHSKSVSVTVSLL